MRTNRRHLLLVAGALYVGAPAFGSPGEALGPGSAIASDLNSRACGLVLLSAGREVIRASKEPLKAGGSVNAERYSQGIAQLVRAALLLKDGRDLADKSAARKLATGAAPLGGPSRPAAIDSCEKWITLRASEVDFDRSDAALADAIAFARLTADTEP